MKDSLQTLNPANGEHLQTYTLASKAKTEEILARSHNAFLHWSKTKIEERARLLNALGNTLLSQKDSLALLATLEMGKLLSEAKSEVEKCAAEAQYYFEHGPKMFADERAPVAELEAYVSFLPLGTILAVMPWNFPYWQVMRFAVPTLLAGNTILLKHASNVTGCALLLDKVFRDAGFPEGVFQCIVTPSSEVKSLIEDMRIQGVSLTGSVGAGRMIASQAGQALKKSVLELGGSDAFIVLEDADLELAVKAAISARFSNAGQVCIAAKRFILVNSIAAEFEERFVAATRELITGDPLKNETSIGPLAKPELREELDQQVKKSISQGAKLLTGGKIKPGPGFFYEPTVLGDVDAKMVVAREETFGPVAALMRVKNDEAAIATANDSIYGLSSNLWTQDLQKAKLLARRIEAGSVFVNAYSKSDPRIPIGGIKASGYGRELSHFGPREFVNIQTVWLHP